MSVQRGERVWGLGDGMRLAIYARRGRDLDNQSRTLRRPRMSQQADEQGAVKVYARSDDDRLGYVWQVNPDGTIKLTFDYTVEAEVDLLGIALNYPASSVQSKRWLGRGPYRVYRNRLEGGVLNIHELAFNDPIPGQTYAYPEFKGYFREWAWLTLETTDGPFTIINDSGVTYLGLF